MLKAKSLTVADVWSALFPLAKVRGKWIGLLCIGFSCAVFFFPGTPLTMMRADLRAASGNHEGAVVLYDQVANRGWSSGQRLLALRRSATLWSVALGVPDESRRRLERYAILVESPAERARTWVRVGQSYSRFSHQPVYAARSFQRAAENASTIDEKAAYQLLAASSLSEAGQLKRATVLWDRVAKDSVTHRAAALIASGQQSLRQGNAEDALGRFGDAVDAALMDDDRGLAKLGLAICLERLGNLEGAIAEMDGADLPSELRDVRVQAMQERKAQLH
jgi:tetratricopeptide (TPR) repeat protein